MTKGCPCYGGRQSQITGEWYCPWGAYGPDWTPDTCEECEELLARQDELFEDCKRDEPREGDYD